MGNLLRAGGFGYVFFRRGPFDGREKKKIGKGGPLTVKKKYLSILKGEKQSTPPVLMGSVIYLSLQRGAFEYEKAIKKNILCLFLEFGGVLKFWAGFRGGIGAQTRFKTLKKKKIIPTG